jgi:hypothetical protein
MSKQLKLSDYDFVFLSYDEPNADQNYENVQQQIPWVKRVHGVKGSDAAHKACADVSETDRLIIIDGDNWIYDGLLKETITVADDIDLTTTVFSWPGKNAINGLVYGNGGIKFWPKNAILNMKTHEASDPSDLKSQVDFCWAMNYIRIDRCFSEVRNNASPFQAWRAGFREGVKMSLVEGSKAKDIKDIWPGNLKNLLIWMSVGLDADNGAWAILGARQGCYLTNFTDWDYTQVRDFDYLNQYWLDKVQHLSQLEILKSCKRLEMLLKEKFNIVRPLHQDQSQFLKQFILVHRNEHTPSEYYSLNHEQFRINIKESGMFL